MEPCLGDLALSDRDTNSSRDKSADSSSDISGLFPEPMVLGWKAGFLVLLPARPARGGREAGRTVRGADVLSAVGPVIVVSGGESARGRHGDISGLPPCGCLAPSR